LGRITVGKIPHSREKKKKTTIVTVPAPSGGDEKARRARFRDRSYQSAPKSVALHKNSISNRGSAQTVRRGAGSQYVWGFLSRSHRAPKGGAPKENKRPLENKKGRTAQRRKGGRVLKHQFCIAILSACCATPAFEEEPTPQAWSAVTLGRAFDPGKRPV